MACTCSKSSYPVSPHNTIHQPCPLAILISVSFTYILKCIFYFEAVKREYFHPVRVNFFFAPWVVCMFLATSVPPLLAPEDLHPALWCAPSWDLTSSLSSRSMANGYQVERGVFARDFQQANHWLRSSIPCPLCSLLPHLLQALLGKLYMVIFMGCQGRTYQLFHRVRVFSGMVVLYLPHDNSIRDNNQVRRECPWSSKQGTCT